MGKGLYKNSKPGEDCTMSDERSEWVSIGVKADTRSQIHAKKRGKDTVDDVVRRAVNEYDPADDGDT